MSEPPVESPWRRKYFTSALFAALALGLFLQWPSYYDGFRSDDYVQWAMFREAFAAPRSKLDLFSFAAGTPEDYRRLVDYGHLPWWAHPELRLRMWRPLASALMALDFSLWGTDARLHHVHTLLWFGLLLWAASRVFWRTLPPPAAALASVLFAAGPCHTIPVGWLANRSTLVACTLAFVAIELLLRTQQQAGRTLKLACAAMSTLALLCGEYAISALMYGLCLSALSSQPHGTAAQRWRARLRMAAPVLVPMLGYLVLHSLLGHAIAHSGYYISPMRSPLEFLQAVLVRVPVLVADLFGLPSFYHHSGNPWREWLLSQTLIPMELWLRLPDWDVWHVGIGYAAIGCSIGLHWLVRKRLGAAFPPGWLVLGALASTVPAAGSLPEDRLLTAATLGGSALLSSVLVLGWRALRQPLPTATRLGVAALWLFAIWVPYHACVRSYDDVRAVRWGSDVARAWCLKGELPEEDAANTRVYVVSSADFTTAVNLPWLRWLEAGKPLPKSYRRLSPGPMPLRLNRPSDRVLELWVMTSDVYGAAVPALYRDASAPVTAGERHELDGMSVTVTEAYQANPQRMRFEMDRSLDDPSLWFIAATQSGLRRISMPAVGESIVLPYAQYFDVR